MAVTVQKGQVSMGSGDTSVTVTISAVTLANTWTRASYSVDSAAPNTALISRELTNTTTLTFRRDSSGVAVTINWCVYESTDFTVQRGVTSIVAPGPTRNITITAVDLAKTFAHVTTHRPGTGYGMDDPIASDLTTTTNLQLTMGRTNLVVDATNIYWEVVEISTASVQKSTVVMDAQTKTATISSVDTTKTFLIATGKITDGVSVAGGDDFPAIWLSSATQISLERVQTGTSTTFTAIIYAVTISTGLRVQRGTLDFTGGDNSEDVSFSSVDTSKSNMNIIGHNDCLASSANTSDEFGGFAYLGTLTSATAGNVARANSGSDAGKVGWEVIEWDYTPSGGPTTIATRMLLLGVGR